MLVKKALPSRKYIYTPREMDYNFLLNLKENPMEFIKFTNFHGFWKFKNKTEFQFVLKPRQNLQVKFNIK